MPGIYPMAAITLAASFALYGGMIYLLSGRNAQYLWLLMPALPLSALVNRAIKGPLAAAVGQVGGVEPGLGLQTPLWFILFLALLPPVTEEAIKVSPLLLPRVRAMAAGPAGALWTGMALGVGFGLGEAAFIAYGVAQSPQYAGLPWYLFTGYLGERLMVTFFHGALAAMVVSGLRRGVSRGLLAYLGAAALHLLANSGAMLYQLKVIPDWAATTPLLLAMILATMVFERLRRSAAQASEGPGQAGEVVYYRARPNG